VTAVFNVALTGNVAAGKSSVAEFWRQAGVPVLSSDQLARDVVEPGSVGLAEVVSLFGDAVLTDDGELDRAVLRARVFQNPDERRRLETILHPRIWRQRMVWTAEQEQEGHALVIAEVPLLFEAGLADQFDATVLIDAPEAQRLNRLVELRHLERAEALRIMEAQLDPDIKRERADYVLDNSGSLEDLASRAKELLEQLREDAERRTLGRTDRLGSEPKSLPGDPP
jgi:dephospho-CoA kinase